jgi:hypothetical protein
MLLEIFPYYQGDLKDLTVTVLYSEFIDLVIRRELTKKARETFSVQERRRFASKLAFWMWENIKGIEIITTKLPEVMFIEFSRPGIDIDSIKRDLLAGCFLERKPPEGLYLPHRSFMEFLVAERLCEMVMNQDDAILNVSYVSPEITRFFVDLIGKKSIGAWREWLIGIKGAKKINSGCIDLLRTSCEVFGLSFTSQHLATIQGDEWGKKAKKIISTEAIEQLYFKRAKKERKGQKRKVHRDSGVTKKKHYRKST